MGFFGSIGKTLFGGSDSKSSSNGFNALPNEIKGAFTNYGQQVQDILKGGNLTNMYTPLAMSNAEQSALSNIGQGFTPDATQLQSDIQMQMNPYNSYVIDEINRQMNGQNSALTSSLAKAGQQNSNRSLLGANDIDLSRGNQIGSFLQNQYNTALNNSLNTLTNSRRADATGALTGATYARDLDFAQKQAPISGLSAISQLLSSLPTSEGSAQSKSSSSSGIGGLLSGAAKLGLFGA